MDRKNFLTDIVEADIAAGRVGGPVGGRHGSQQGAPPGAADRAIVTRFPPEPNGFLHIGHAKSILVNFGLAQQFHGRAHLRFDDTNPTTEDTVYVESIENDVRWLGGDWGKHLYFASDYFPRMYECAERLVREGHAYVDSQSVEAIREGRGSFERPGVDSPFRGRSSEESLALLRRMRKGELADGEAVLRARIDMAHPNVLMRDPLLYRIRHAHHHRTGDAWCLYPMYDFAHPLEDAFEGVTHSICTLEFESNRELYDWVLDHLGPWTPRPRQYEFARLALGYTVMSKRKLLQLVQEKRVTGWDDPRMPTLAGLRRRGVTPEALRDFADRIGVAKNNSLVDIGKLEFSIRSDLEARAPRVYAVLDPLLVTLTDWPEERTLALRVPYYPGDPERGGDRELRLSRQLYIEREDFSREPPADWKRLSPGGAVRLLGASLVVRCDEVIADAEGKVIELRCRQVSDDENAKVSGTLHWVDAATSVPLPVRLYDRLFTVEAPDAEGDFVQHLNPDSLRLAPSARVEAALAAAEPGTSYQFLRQGYFHVDPVDSRPGAPVFHRIIGLKDSWARAKSNAESDRREKKRAAPAAADSDLARQARAEARTRARAEDPEIAARHAAFTGELGLSEDDASFLSEDPPLATYFQAAVDAAPGRAKALAKWLRNEVQAFTKGRTWDELPLTAADLAQVVSAVEESRITAGAAKTILASRLGAKTGSPASAEDIGDAIASLAATKIDGGGALEAAVGRALAKQAAEVARYRAGETKLLAVFVGAVMREMRGAADPAAVKDALTRALDAVTG